MKDFRWTIKRKLLALGAATLLPLLLFLAFWVWWETRARTAHAEAELMLASRQVASQFEGLLENVKEQLRALAQNPAVRRLDRARMAEIFRERIAEHRDLENVMVADADGRYITSAVSLPAGAPVMAADRPWFRRVMATGEPAVGGFQIGRITRVPMAVVAAPLGEGKESGPGVLAIALPPASGSWRTPWGA